jgi:hypothetical protein
MLSRRVRELNQKLNGKLTTATTEPVTLTEVPSGKS